jgi:hypothetical protein
VVSRRGGDPNIGPRLPLLLTDGGFEKVEMTIVQPVGTKGEVKLMNPITLENIADAILQDGLAAWQEIDTLVSARTLSLRGKSANRSGGAAHHPGLGPPAGGQIMEEKISGRVPTESHPIFNNVTTPS